MDCFLPHHVVQYLLGFSAESSQCLANLHAVPPRFVEAMDLRLYLMAFLLTNLFEFPIYAWALRSLPGQTWVKSLSAVIFLNLATHPLIIFGLPQFWARAGWTFGSFAVFGELLAPAMEAMFLLLLCGTTWRTAFSAALIANFLSWGVGGLIAQPLFKIIGLNP